jgi:hypothetical protein
MCVKSDGVCVCVGFLRGTGFIIWISCVTRVLTAQGLWRVEGGLDDRLLGGCQRLCWEIQCSCHSNGY